MSLPWHCHVIAMPLSCHCRVIAMSLPCHGHAWPSWGHISASNVQELSPRSAINGFLASNSAVCAKSRPKRRSGRPFRGRNLLVLRETCLFYFAHSAGPGIASRARGRDCSRRWPQEGPKLAPGGPDAAPRLPQDCPKVVPRWPQGGPKVGPRWLQEALRRPHDSPGGAKMAPRLRDGPELAPTWPQDGPKMA